MKKSRASFIIIVATVIMAALPACKDSKSYAELLNEETKYVNNFLADQRVTNEMPTDTNFVFETGPDAPYYRLDEDGFLYMQVINPGTKGNYVKDNQVIFFRFTRYDLQQYTDGELPQGQGNEYDMSYMNSWFRYGNYQLETSYQWGSGIQQPLMYLPIDCEVNIVIKSQYGFYSEQSYVVPYLFNVRYYPQIS